MLIVLLNCDLSCPNWSYQGQNHQMAELPNDRITKFILMEIDGYTICPILSNFFLNDLAYETSIFKKFIFELEASDSFKKSLVFW